jgi:hypothetical protein
MSRHTFAFFFLSVSLFPFSQAAPVAILPSADKDIIAKLAEKFS